MKNIPLLIIALIGCFYLGIVAHELRHMFQKEYTDLCFSLRKPVAYVYNRDKIYFESDEEHRRLEIAPVIWGMAIWLCSSVYVLRKFEVL